MNTESERKKARSLMAVECEIPEALVEHCERWGLKPAEFAQALLDDVAGRIEAESRFRDFLN